MRRVIAICAVTMFLAAGCANGKFSFSKAVGCATFGLAGGQCFESEEPEKDSAP